MKRRHAFTLLEVTLATAIFALAIIVLTSAFSNAITAMQMIRKNNGDEPIFRYLNSLIITIPDLNQFEQGEELDLPDDAKASWTATVEPTTVADLFKVELTITLSKNGEKPVVRVSDLYLLRPTWSDSDDRSKIITQAKTDLANKRNTVQ